MTGRFAMSRNRCDTVRRQGVLNADSPTARGWPTRPPARCKRCRGQLYLQAFIPGHVFELYCLQCGGFAFACGRQQLETLGLSKRQIAHAELSGFGLVWTDDPEATDRALDTRT